MPANFIPSVTRTTAANRALETPPTGALVYETDTGNLYIGDGSTAGGVLIDGGGGASVSDAAYDATGWNGVTTIAPSKNAIRDKFVTNDANIQGLQDTLNNSSNVRYSAKFSEMDVTNDFLSDAITVGTLTERPWDALDAREGWIEIDVLYNGISGGATAGAWALAIADISAGWDAPANAVQISDPQTFTDSNNQQITAWDFADSNLDADRATIQSWSRAGLFFMITTEATGSTGHAVDNIYGNVVYPVGHTVPAFGVAAGTVAQGNDSRFGTAASQAFALLITEDTGSFTVNLATGKSLTIDGDLNVTGDLVVTGTINGA